MRGLPARRTTPAQPITDIPRTKEDADHSLPFLLAMGTIDGMVGPAQYAHEQWKLPRVQALMRKVWLQGDAELTRDFPARWTAIVEISTTDGHTWTERIDAPKGNPDNPLTDEELNAKFSSLASPLMPRSQIEQIEKTVYALDRLGDVAMLTRLLSVRVH